MDKSLPQEKKTSCKSILTSLFSTVKRWGISIQVPSSSDFLSLLENTDSLKAGDKIALYSYGSGAVAEFFSGALVEGYEAYLDKDRLNKLNQRTALSVADYEKSSLRK